MHYEKADDAKKESHLLGSTRKDAAGKWGLGKNAMPTHLAGEACAYVGLNDERSFDTVCSVGFGYRGGCAPEELAGTLQSLEHEQVDVTQLQTNAEALGNILNTCLDSALCAVTFGLKKCGIVPGIAVMLVSAWLSQLNILLNLRSCALCDLPQTSCKFNYVAFAKTGESCFIFFNALFPFLQMVSYVFVTVDAVRYFSPKKVEHLIDSSEKTVLVLKLVLWLVVFVPLTYCRKLPDVAKLSWAAFAAAATFVLCVVLQSCLILPAQAKTQQNSFGGVNMDALLWPESFASFCTGFPILALLFCGEYGAQVGLATLKDRSYDNQRKVARLSYVVLFCVYSVVGIFGLLGCMQLQRLTPEVPGDGNGNVLLSLGSGTCILIANAAIVVLVALSYVIEAVPLKFVLLELVCGKDELREEASYGAFACITTVINVAVLVVALQFRNLAQVLTMNAVSVAIVGFILPPLVFLKLLPTQRSLWTRRNNAKYLFSIAIGTALLFIAMEEALMEQVPVSMVQT